ncbi:hypothetical protein QJS66_14715 [Kocuria rhizophila]|nr:hypothetical protein QJS66_14715 [Kocuria rhizophila]
MQDGHLFHDTIRANLAVAREGVTHEEVWTLWERCGCARHHRVPAGRAGHRGGERGYRLSGGEAAAPHDRPAAPGAPARGPWTRPPPHWTPPTRPRAGRAGRGHVRSHRRGDRPPAVLTIRRADQILVVEAGRIAERDHEEVAARGGRYAELHETQFAATTSGHDDAR